jgi:hypothetical protein
MRCAAAGGDFISSLPARARAAVLSWRHPHRFPESGTPAPKIFFIKSPYALLPSNLPVSLSLTITSGDFLAPNAY